MTDIIDFFIAAGKLKKMQRRGWVIRGIKNPETIAEHTFRMALMAWIFGKKGKINIDKILKMALIHDLCEVYAGDITPYDHLIKGKSKQEIKKIVQKWPALSKREKEKYALEKHEKENKSLEKITEPLSKELKQEIFHLWEDYEKGKTKEGRFVRQLDRIENLLQAIEYWKEDKKFPIGPWWTQMKGLIDDSNLLEFMNQMDNYYFSTVSSK